MGRAIEVTAEIDTVDTEVTIDIDEALREATDDELVDALIDIIGFMDSSALANLKLALRDEVGFNVHSIDDELKMDLLKEKFSKYNWTKMTEIFEQYERNNSPSRGTSTS